MAAIPKSLRQPGAADLKSPQAPGGLELNWRGAWPSDGTLFQPPAIEGSFGLQPPGD